MIHITFSLLFYVLKSRGMCVCTWTLFYRFKIEITWIIHISMTVSSSRKLYTIVRFFFIYTFILKRHGIFIASLSVYFRTVIRSAWLLSSDTLQQQQQQQQVEERTRLHAYLICICMYNSRGLFVVIICCKLLLSLE